MQHFAIEQELLLEELDRQNMSKRKGKAIFLHLELLHRYRHDPTILTATTTLLIFTVTILSTCTAVTLTYLTLPS